jgi:glycosyltransferase involved in cell wall biosynthesis
MKVLTFTTLFPNNIMTSHGIFIMERMKKVASWCELKIVVPVPFFPALKINKKWYQYSKVARIRKYPEFKAYYPRYFITPKVGMIFYGLFLFLSTINIFRKINKRYNFELIDSHYIYPDGFAAVLLAKLFRKKVVVSARGTDINLYPQFPLIQKQILFTLQKADGIIAVCQALKDVMVELGIAEKKIKVIPNGVDLKKFYPVDQNESRKKLKLPMNRKIILSVGNLIERKGFHFIIEALAQINSELTDEDCPLLIIVGEGEYRTNLEQMIRNCKLEDQVILVGAQSHTKLNAWYNSCDLFCLASSREGWPNVIFEALACGKPVVATKVWGVPEIIKSDNYGLLVNSQSPSQISDKIKLALNKNWNRKDIIQYARNNDWKKVGKKVYQMFQSTILQ